MQYSPAAYRSEINHRQPVSQSVLAKASVKGHMQPVDRRTDDLVRVSGFAGNPLHEL
jgi:hypothetical protein